MPSDTHPAAKSHRNGGSAWSARMPKALVFILVGITVGAALTVMTMFVTGSHHSSTEPAKSSATGMESSRATVLPRMTQEVRKCVLKQGSM